MWYKNNGYKYKTISIKEYLDEIKPYLKDIINNLKKSDTWKIQSTKAINFRLQFVHILFIIQLRPTMGMHHAVIINYFLVPIIRTKPDCYRQIK